jgi:hypothetical protein
MTMTREEIAKLAREAQLSEEDGLVHFNIIHFAAIVAAREREECAKLVDHILKEGGGTYGDAIRAPRTK